MIPWWILILIGIAIGAGGTALVLTAQQRQVIDNLLSRMNSLQTQINRLHNQILEMRVIYQSDVNQINAQINSIVLEIQALKRENESNAEMLSALDQMESKLKELIRRKREVLASTYGS